MKFDVHTGIIASDLTHEEAHKLNYPGGNGAGSFRIEKDGMPLPDQSVDIHVEFRTDDSGAAVAVFVPPPGCRFIQDEEVVPW